MKTGKKWRTSIRTCYVWRHVFTATFTTQCGFIFYDKTWFPNLYQKIIFNTSDNQGKSQMHLIIVRWDIQIYFMQSGEFFLWSWQPCYWSFAPDFQGCSRDIFCQIYPNLLVLPLSKSLSYTFAFSSVWWGYIQMDGLAICL